MNRQFRLIAAGCLIGGSAVLTSSGRGLAQDPPPQPMARPLKPMIEPPCGSPAAREAERKAREKGEMPVCRPPLAQMVGGDLMPRIVPWQAQIYSTYAYTDADVAEDVKKSPDDPSKAYLDRKETWERTHRCGGVYIGDGWVLTAAHCVTDAPKDYLKARRVRLGVLDLSQAGEGARIDRVAVNKDYETVGHSNDIALLKVDFEGRIPASARGVPILGDKPGDEPLNDYDLVTITGWGATGAREGGALLVGLDGNIERASPIVKKVGLAVLPFSRCEEVPAYRGKLKPSMICAGSTIEGEDACTWDSGGPMTRMDPAGPVLVGLISWGKGCGLKGVPAIYTRVSSFRAWIARAKKAPRGKVTYM